jgi:hypothetical protein
LTHYNKALIASRTPFVVNGNQLYLPFIGAALRERYAMRQETSEILSPTAQLILFRYLYQNEHDVYRFSSNVPFLELD